MKIAAFGTFYSDEAWAGIVEHHRGQPLIILTGSMEEVREVAALYGSAVAVHSKNTTDSGSDGA